MLIKSVTYKYGEVLGNIRKRAEERLLENLSILGTGRRTKPTEGRVREVCRGQRGYSDLETKGSETFQ